MLFVTKSFLILFIYSFTNYCRFGDLDLGEDLWGEAGVLLEVSYKKGKRFVLNF